MEDVLSRYQNKVNNIILSGLGSALTVITIYLIYRDVSSQTISVLSIVQNILMIFFVYQVLDIASLKWVKPDITKRYLYAFEFLKLLLAMSITATIQYYLISRPILNQEFKPSTFHVTLLLAIPAAVISRILYELKLKKQKDSETLPDKNPTPLLAHNPAMQSQMNYLILLLSGFAVGGILVFINFTARLLTLLTLNLLMTLFYITCTYFIYQLLDLMDKQWGIRTKNGLMLFTVEFLKLFSAFFIAANAQYYLINRPILYQSYDLNYLYVLFSASVPAAVIARLVIQMRQAKDIALQSRLAQAEAQYNLLETQMQPHFLFNSLNVLSELIYVDPDLACSVTQQLADLYREILSNSKRNFSNLGSEISIIKKYIQIQKIRFGDRIRFKSDIDAEHFEVAVPSLILQTLVENAIKHGISPRQEGGEILLSIKPIDKMFEITVANTGEPFRGDLSTTPRQTQKHQGTGLQNTKNRLELFYGRSHGFRIHSDEKMTYVSFRVPQEGVIYE